MSDKEDDWMSEEEQAVKDAAKKFFTDDEWDFLFNDEAIQSYYDDLMDVYDHDVAQGMIHMLIVGSVCDDIARCKPKSLAEAFKTVFEIKYTATLISEKLAKAQDNNNKGGVLH